MLKSNIKTNYVKHDCKRICQGDIFQNFSNCVINENKDVIEIFFPFIIIITQDCDLEEGLNKEKIKEENGEKIFNQFLPNILILPAFTAESLREGNHLINLYHYKQDRINSDRWSTLKDNKNERYHFLNKDTDLQIPDLVVDFKTYYTIDTIYLLSNFKEKYLTTINELFREKLAQRFAYYTNRIGLPNI